MSFVQNISNNPWETPVILRCHIEEIKRFPLVSFNEDPRFEFSTLYSLCLPSSLCLLCESDSVPASRPSCESVPVSVFIHVCSGLNKNSPHRLIFWMFTFQLVLCSGRIRRYGLVGGTMSLWVDFEVSKGHFSPILSLTSAYRSGCKPSALTLFPRLPAYHDGNGLALLNYKQSPK